MRLFLLSALCLVGCANKDAPGASPAPAPMAAKAPAAPAPSRGGGLTGRVLETLEAPSYTYLRLSTATGEQWAAIPTATVAVGSEVTVMNPMVMKNFASKTLNRTFDEILFASGVEQGAAAPPHAQPPQVAVGAAPAPGFEKLSAWAEQAAPGTKAASVAAAPVVTVEPVAKATGAGAATVAEIYKQRAALLDKPVLLRGKVVKYTSGVLGKNWLHLRDGSGTEDGKDNDIAVTTTDVAALGEIVAVQGPVHLSRDFGAGYVFPVMIEDAKVVR